MSIKIAVVGAGFMGSLHARTVSESAGATLAALRNVAVNDAILRSVASGEPEDVEEVEETGP